MTPTNLNIMLNPTREIFQWGCSKYFKNRKLLVDKGFLRTDDVRGVDSETGKKVVTGFRAWINLGAYNQYLDKRSECQLSASSKTTPLSKTTTKGALSANVAKHGEVIDDQDDMETIQF